MKLLSTLIMFVAVYGMLTGCATSSSRHYSSNVVQYLYPNQKQHIEMPQIPLLSLPLKVGIAFVPETTGIPLTLTELNKMDLMNEVSTHFKKYDFVKSIEIISSPYLTRNGSFTNLDQISTMFDIDVIALLSYDQTRFTDEGFASITYWTIIGAYLIPGEKNDTHTMVDATVYDIKSRKMLFRAPGTSHIKSLATPINLSEQVRKDSLSGFKLASKELVVNLEQQLMLFKNKVKAAPQDYKVVHKPGYTGGGSLDLYFLILVMLLGSLRLWIFYRKEV